LNLATKIAERVFLKLIPGNPPAYGMSKVFDLLNPGNDLYHVLAVLKNIRQLALNEQTQETDRIICV
jgi:hypothetical protein